MANEQQAEAAKEETSPPLIDDLEAAWEAAEGKVEGDETGENETTKEVEKETGKDEVKTEIETEKEAETETEKEVEEADKEPVKSEAQDTDGGEADVDPVGPPEHWDEAQKSDFESLPVEAQSLYLEKSKSLEAGYNKKFEEVAIDRKSLDGYKGFKEIFAPYENELAMAGTNPEAYVKQLVATASQLAADPEATLRHLATQYGVVLNGKATEAADELDEFTDPEIRALHAKIDGLSSELDQSKQREAVNQSQTANSQVQEVEREWSVFTEAKSEAGEATHPHANDLRHVVGAELQQNPVTPGETTQDAIKRAYDVVKWQQPELRESLLASQAKEKDAVREKQRKADLQKAKKTGRNVKTKSKSVSETEAPAGTVKEELERVWDQVDEAVA